MKVFSQLRLPSIQHMPSLPSASRIRGELRLAQEALQRAGRSIRRHVLRQPVPGAAPHHGPEQTGFSMNPAERWNHFSQLTQIAYAICKLVSSKAGGENEELRRLLDNVEDAAASLHYELHSTMQQSDGYLLEPAKARRIVDSQLTQLVKAILDLDGASDLPKSAGHLVCDFDELSIYLHKEAKGQATSPAPKILDASMQSGDIRDLEFLHDLIRDDVVENIADHIDTNLSGATYAIKKGDEDSANQYLLSARELFVKLKQHLQVNYSADQVQAHCAAIDQRLRFFED